MSVVNVETGEIVEFDRAAAERRAERITLRLDAIADNYRAVLPMIREAIEKRDDLALGYRSPGDYVSDRFGQSLAGLGIEVRRAVVGELTQAGLSTRAIAPVVGVSDRTVQKDRQAGVRDLTPDTQTPEPVEDGEADAGSGQTPQGEAAPGDDARRPVPSDSLPRPAVTGIDGKTYPKPKPKKPARKPLTDSFRDAALDLDKLVSRWQRLADDDRFPRNKNEVARYANDLIRAREALDRLIEQMSTNEKEPTSV